MVIVHTLMAYISNGNDESTTGNLTASYISMHVEENDVGASTSMPELSIFDEA